MPTSQFRSDPVRGFRFALGTTLLIALAWLLVAGGMGVYADLTCDVYPVSGTIVVDGRAPVGAKLEFHRVNADQFVVTTPAGVVDTQGRFQVTSIANRSGAPAGEYIVTVQWTPEHIGYEGVESGPNLLPARYASSATSPLRISVGTGANNLPPMEISCRCTEALLRQRDL